MVPRSACSNLPICFSVAPVNEPFSWPKSSDSISSSGMAAQLTWMNRSRLRRLLRWMARPTSSLPAPLSPSRSTVAVVGAATVLLLGEIEEHTSELQSPDHLVCRLLLEKKKRVLCSALLRRSEHG